MGDHPPPAGSASAPSEPDAGVSKAGARVARRVLLGLFVLSLVVSGIAYVKFSHSEQLILADLQAMKERGKTLGVDACLDDVLDWHANRCTAMQSLCERSVGRLMEQCLDARDRTDYCTGLDLSSDFVTINPATGRPMAFGDADCDRRAGKSRGLRKQCGTAYRAIAFYCSEVQKRTAVAVTAATTGKTP